MIVSIFLAASAADAPGSVTEAVLATGSGIVGDRNFGRNDYPGQNLTLIESEAVERYNAQFGQAIKPESTRRNIVTRGVELNALVGREFSIGTARLKGVELCTPCGYLGELLENECVSRAEVVKAFVTSGGLRADVLDGGTVAVGMAITIPGDSRDSGPRPGDK
jgi:MOSC domain-containing protein YiiM